MSVNERIIRPTISGPPTGESITLTEEEGILSGRPLTGPRVYRVRGPTQPW